MNKIIKVMVLCEESGIVRRSFKRAGANWVWSVDLLPSEDDDPHHIQGDVFDVLDNFEKDNVAPDLILAFPPCTYMASSGNRWYSKSQKRLNAVDWTLRLWDRCKDLASFVAMENPVGVLSTALRKHDPHMIESSVQPWQFGHHESKQTKLFLSRLPKLLPTNIVEGREQKIWKMGPSKERSKMRSKTYVGIAKAMTQWLPFIQAMKGVK
mgnify:CR=1 FL=1